MPACSPAPRRARDRAAAAEAAGDDRRDRAVHRLGHQAASGSCRTRRRSCRRRSAPCCSSARPVAAADRPVKRVEQRDHDGHVGAADRQHDDEAEDRRARRAARCIEHVGGRRPRRSPTAQPTATTSSTPLSSCWPCPRPIGRPGQDLLQLAERDERAPEARSSRRSRRTATG